MAGPVTVGDLVREMDEAIKRMSTKNPHRSLLIRVGNALVEMAQKNIAHEQREAARQTAADAEPKVVLA